MDKTVTFISGRCAAMRDILHTDMGLSMNVIKRAKRTQGGIVLNGENVHTDRRVYKDDVVKVCINCGENSIPPTKGTLNTVFEDEEILIIDKEGGIAVHPSQGNRKNTVANIFSYLYKDMVFRPVNRLDKGTSGLMVIAKNPLICKKLCDTLHTTFRKEYLALCEGWFDIEEGTIDVPIMRAEGSVILRRTGGDKKAVTHYRVQKQGIRSLVMFVPVTGRTHQIRVHAAHMGHPVVNDFLYGTETGEIGRHALHCAHIEFDYNGKTASFDAPLPEDMKGLIE